MTLSGTIKSRSLLVSLACVGFMKVDLARLAPTFERFFVFDFKLSVARVELFTLLDFVAFRVVFDGRAAVAVSTSGYGSSSSHSNAGSFGSTLTMTSSPSSSNPGRYRVVGASLILIACFLARGTIPPCVGEKPVCRHADRAPHHNRTNHD
ncbi:hypothetical protein IG631_13927 [Alternaria alternata]|nr:hypothetical protein IG631_13927 [Alternaria alternata]